MSYLLQFDGASNPNPGPSGSAYVLYSPIEVEKENYVRKPIQEGYIYIPHATNNEAEYKAIILGMEQAHELNIEHIEIEGDSNLVVNQVLGNWKAKEPNIIPLVTKARNLYQTFKTKKIRHIPREENKDADVLSKEALKTQQEIHRLK